MKLQCDYYPSGKKGAPGVVALHMFRNVRQSWKPVAAKFAEAGIDFLAVDMRGHGESKVQDGKDLSERVYFRDDPPEPGSTWFCPHCAAENPLGDPRKDLRPSCADCSKPLDPASATPPPKGGCLSLLLLPLGLGLWAALALG